MIKNHILCLCIFYTTLSLSSCSSNIEKIKILEQSLQVINENLKDDAQAANPMLKTTRLELIQRYHDLLHEKNTLEFNLLQAINSKQS